MDGFKSSGKRRNVRKRKVTSSSSDGGSSSEEESSVVRGERKGKGSNPMRAASCVFTKGKKEEKKELIPVYKSTKSSVREGPADGGATSTIQTETAIEEDQTAVFKRALEESRKDDVGEEYKEVYKGNAGYQKFIEIKDTAVANAGGGNLKLGPIRAPAHLRATVRWDYAPDICKDYKETGFCGFGDSCKFMHDRGDYKSGWQLERDWDSKEYGARDEENYEISDDEEDLPFACYICRNPFKDPVVTKCKHYFCESCAIAEFKKSKKCFVCEKPTGGIFNPAKEIITKMKEMADD